MTPLVGVLRSCVLEYRDSCRKDFEKKNSEPSLGMILEAADPNELAEAASIIIRQGVDAIEDFASGKVAFSILSKLNRLKDVPNEYARLGRLFAETGAPNDALAVHRLAYEDKLLKQHISPKDLISIKLSAAKAYRNLGRFAECFATYRDAMAAASELGDESMRCLIFLLIGKLYGSYCGQRSLFCSFVEEARLRLSDLASRSSTHPHHVQRYAAICEDALGQAYRHMDPQRARQHFAEAIRLNHNCGYRSGLIRARCHLAQLSFGAATTPREAQDSLTDFELALRELQELSSDERGLGIRWLQFSEMLHSVGRQKEASEALELSKQIARLYSDHRTLVRATVVEAARMGDSLEQAESMISSALSIAKQFNLNLHERELNRTLADVHIRLGGSPDRVAGLLERNNDIIAELLGEVGTTLTALSATDVVIPEFIDLSTATRNDFRARVLLDYDNAVKELSQSVASLIAAVKAVEARRQELLILGVVNSMSRVILHDLKVTLPDDESLNPFHHLSSQIRVAGIRLRAAIDEHEPIDRTLVHRESANLEDFAVQVEDLGASLNQLKSLLAAKIKRPWSLNSWVHLGSAANSAIADARLLLPDCATVVHCRQEIEVEVLSDDGLMRNVIQQLISNGLQALRKLSPPPGGLASSQTLLEIRIGSRRVYDSAVGISAEAPTLQVVCQFFSESEAFLAHSQIAASLRGEKLYSTTNSGFGLELTQTVFEGFMDAKVTAFLSGDWAGVTVEFSSSNGKARIMRKAIS